MRFIPCAAPPLAAAALALAVLLPFAPARAADNGFYVGASIGRSNVKAGDVGFSAHDTGWKVTAGLRPIDLLGAEVSYVDFGTPKRDIGAVRVDSDTKGAAAFGLLYLPLPIPLVDVYAKAGFARLDQDITSSSFRLSRKHTDFAYGAGAQAHWGSLAVRAEYERFETEQGKPNLLSLGVTWTFL